MDVRRKFVWTAAVMVGLAALLAARQGLFSVLR